MKLKNLLSFFVFIITGIFFFFGLVLPVYAADVTAVVEIPKNEVKSGETLDAIVYLNINNGYDIFSYDITLSYNRNFLRVEGQSSIIEESLFDKSLKRTAWDNTRGTVKISRANLTDEVINGRRHIASVKFKAIKGTKNPENISVSSLQVYDTSRGRVTSTGLQGASYTVIATERSDTAASQCVTSTGVKGTTTELGCIPNDPAGFVSSFYSMGLGIIGAVAILFIIYGGYLLMTSGGNASQISKGRSYIIYAMSGLLLAILGYVFMEVILVDVLQIPGIQ